jgi:hypothetical protein
MAFILSENLKDLSRERRWAKSAENLGTSPFQRDPSNDNTFNQINFFGQSLQNNVCDF